MEQLRSKVLLAVLALAVAFGTASVALAQQPQFDLRTNPTFVIKTGRSEVMGRVILTAPPACGTGADGFCVTVGGSIQVQYTGVGIDNSGAALTVADVVEATVSRAVVAAGISISTNRAAATLIGPTAQITTSNTSTGGVIAIPILGGLDLAAGDSIAIDGVRGRIDLSPGNTPAGSPGTDILAFLTASPSTVASFQPTSEVVARTADGLRVVVTPQTVLQCAPAAPTLSVTLIEGFNAAFVQHVTSLAGTVVATDARPLFGGTANTRFNIVVTSLPTGVVITWPAAALDATVALGGGGTTSTIQLRVASASGSTALYEFVTDPANATVSQGIADASGQRFRVAPTAFTIPATVLGTANAQAQLNPPLVTAEVAFTVTSAPQTPATALRPRFNDPLKNVPAEPFLSIAPCRTNLLWPFVVQDVFPPAAATATANRFLTGFGLANTGRDNPAFSSTACTAVSTPDCGALSPPAGTCTWYAFRQFPTPPGTGTADAGPAPAVISIVRGPITAGDTDTLLASDVVGTANLPWLGYMITVCNFQFAHGFAFVAQNPTGTALNVSHGYLALLIPDPIISVGRLGNNVDFAVFQSGEGLSQ